MTIPLETLRFYHLRKQNLRVRADSGEHRRILKSHLALHSTDYTTPYFSLWARVGDFEPRMLLEDLNRKRAVRLRAFRGTVFVVDAGNVSTILRGSEIYMPGRLGDAVRQAGRLGVDLEVVEEKVRDMLSGGNILPTRTIRENLNLPSVGPQFLIARRYLEFKSVLARAGQRYITDPVIAYTLMEDWIPGLGRPSATPEKALDDLMLGYIRMFGPVTADDIAWWFPLSKTKARQSLARIAEHIVYFDLFEKEHIMENEDYRKLLDFRPPSSEQPVVAFLPYEDHFPKAYKHRDWYISAETTPMLFHTGKIDWGQLRPSVWLDGQIVGRWEMEWTDRSKTGMRVDITDMAGGRARSRDIQTLIERKQEELESFVNGKMVPLMKKPQVKRRDPSDGQPSGDMP